MVTLCCHDNGDIIMTSQWNPWLPVGMFPRATISRCNLKAVFMSLFIVELVVVFQNDLGSPSLVVEQDNFEWHRMVCSTIYCITTHLI